MEDLVKFYSGKKVLITGHTGFKGAWLALWLKQLGAQVSGFALAPTDTNLHDILKTEITSTYGDIRDLEQLRAKFDTVKPEIVFHLAAQAIVLESYENPLATYETNIMGTLNVLQSAIEAGSVNTIVNITSDKCYEDAGSKAYVEEDKLGGYDPYSSSKAAAEIVSAAYRRSFLAKNNIAMSTARGGNVIGGGDFADYRLVPDLFRAQQENVPVIIRNPGNIRPWQHVLDALHGYLQLGYKLGTEKQKFASAFNFGPDNLDVNVITLAEKFAKATKGKNPVVQQDPNAPHESFALKLDNSKAKRELGWKPVLDTNETIEWTAAWYAEYLSNPKNIVEFTNSQLAKFRGKS